MSNQLTSRELDNIYKTYAQYGEEHLSDFIRAIWKEAFDEGYNTGMVDEFNKRKAHNVKR